jgi:TetR/AcrR family transcriptional regulator of autoinduction and epiphytic fitness
VPTATAERRVTRPYSSVVRAEQARRTRGRVLEAAHRLFVERGYPATSMRAVAAAADVAVPTVELLFGTKPRLLTAVIDVAIAGDDEPVGVLDRDWAVRAREAPTARELLRVAAGVLRAGQERSAGVLLAAYEAATGDPAVARLVHDQEERRALTARWLVEGLVARTPLRPGVTLDDATESVWALMDPVLFVRLTRRRGWPAERYETWWAESVLRLLTDEEEP